MKCFAALAVLLLMVILSPARAQKSPDDQYVIIYALMQQADTFENSGDLHQALADYVEARNELEKFQKVFPGSESENRQLPARLPCRENRRK